MAAAICPHCGIVNESTEDNKKDMDECGKTCFSCPGCDRLFVLRDDGDGEYVMF